MKVWNLILLVGLLTISVTSMSQDKNSAKNQLQLIVDSLQKDTSNFLYKREMHKIKSIAKSIEENGFSKGFIFPYEDYNRVIGYKVDEQFVRDNNIILLGETCIDTSTMKLKKFMDKNDEIKNIQQNKIEKVLEIVNNPLNFDWGIHDSRHLKAGILFLNKKNKIIAFINIFNDGHQLEFTPNNFRFKNGMLKREYGNEMQLILREIGILY